MPNPEEVRTITEAALRHDRWMRFVAALVTIAAYYATRYLIRVGLRWRDRRAAYRASKRAVEAYVAGRRPATLPPPAPPVAVVVRVGDVWGGPDGADYVVRRPLRLRNGHQAWDVVRVMRRLPRDPRWHVVADSAARMHRWAIEAGRWSLVERGATVVDGRDPGAA